jgi:hypothetical protein
VIRNIRPIRAVFHPMWLLALAILVVNDHALKYTHDISPWVTGKLSDFAGLIVAPLVLAIVFRVQTHRGFKAAHVAIGVGFSAINLFPVFAHSFEALMSHTPFPWHITVDPSDLIALPMLLISYSTLTPSMEVETTMRPLAEKALLAASGIACMATSPPPSPNPRTPSPRFMSGIAAIENHTGQDRIIRIRSVRKEIALDCNALLTNPKEFLNEETFDKATAWSLPTGGAIPITTEGTSSSCAAFLVDAEGLRATLLYFPQPQQSSSLRDQAGASPADRAMKLVPTNGRLELTDHSSIQGPLVPNAIPTEGTCVIPDEATDIGWDISATGSFTIAKTTLSPDGCYAIEYKEKTRDYVCVPPGAMPFVPGEKVNIEVLDDEVLFVSIGKTMTITRSGKLGTGLSFLPTEGCTGQQVSCGSSALPLKVVLSGSVNALYAGDSVNLSDTDRFFLVRAQQMPVHDLGCYPEPYFFQYVRTHVSTTGN